jgi:hypothetical protein
MTRKTGLTPGRPATFTPKGLNNSANLPPPFPTIPNGKQTGLPLSPPIKPLPLNPMQTPDDMAANLAALLTKVSESPEAAAIIAAAVRSYYDGTGAQERHDGTAALLLFNFAAAAARNGAEEMTGQCEFYKEEAGFTSSDLAPRDCRRWAKQYAAAAAAFAAAAAAINQTSAALAAGIKKSGI